MLVSTPRLCNDATFLPPSQNKPNLITCRKVLEEGEFLQMKEAEAKAAIADHASNQQPLKIEDPVEKKPREAKKEITAEKDVSAAENGAEELATIEQVILLLQQEL